MTTLDSRVRGNDDAGPVIPAKAGIQRLAPRTADEVAEVVRVANADRTPLRIAGAATWLHSGMPVEASQVLGISCLTGITEYVPGDLTLTAMAGTPLQDIAEATAAHGQWLPLDPFGSPEGTLGATLATASAGPLGGSIGQPRDVTVGVSYVTGTGDVVRGGGRVVKNVAGFDLVRLTIGAWGTLGVITEATVRLRARPEADETVAMALPEERDALGVLLAAVRVAAVEPLAAELLSPACAARVGLGAAGVMLVRLAGNTTSVHHQRVALSRLSACELVPAETWLALRQSDPADAAVARVSRRPSELSRLWSVALGLPGIDAHATLSRGIVRLRLAQDQLGVLDRFDAADRVVIETGPVGVYQQTAPAATDALGRRLRDAFDPARILNRGIFGPEAP